MAGGLQHGGRGGLGLGKKVGPLPAWGWGVIILAVLAWFLFFRKSNSGTTATVGQAASVYTPQDNSGQVNAAQSGQPSTASAPADQLSGHVLDTLQAQNSDLIGALTSSMANAWNAGGGVYGTSTGSPVPGATPLPAQPATTVTTPVATQPTGGGAAKPAQAQPFGGIVTKKRLANGSTLTTYANGRQVQQVHGRAPYVIRAGR